MDTFEDTKCSRSIVADSLQCLTEQAQLWRNRIDLLEAGQPFSRAELAADLGKLLDASQNLRDAITSEDSAATWTTKAELHSLVDRLDDVAVKRRRYLSLAQTLASGTVNHRRERTKLDRLAQRDAAVAELMEMSAIALPPDIPGPSVEAWLAWACSLEDGVNDPELLNLKANFPRVDDFVRQLEIETWQDGPAPSAVQMGDAIPALHTAPEPSSPLSITEVKPPNTLNPSQPVSAAEPVDDTSVADISDTAPFTFEPEAHDAQPSAHNGNGNGKLSFFEPSEIEDFSRHIEQAKTDPKAKKVRSLLAISHWLLPQTQDPVLQPNSEIRTQLGDSNPSPVAAVSPEEAIKATSTEDKLILLTGGADLLRASIAQSSGENRDAIASVRRLTLDQIRSWFVGQYKIALSEPQIQDVLTLTSGIPLLVGEMHRVIIPAPDAPPTWIGFAIWNEMKARFEHRVGNLAKELRKGPPAVRLTDREITLLKMVVIASDYSNADNIVSNLMEHWPGYSLPSLPAVTAADENSVALLQSLGLLPMRREAGLSPLKAIVPLAPEDALRKIVNHF